MPLTDFGAARFSDPNVVIMLGRDPFRIDLLTSIPAVEFEAAWNRRTSITLDAVEIPLISREDLLTNKRAVGRLQDLADVEAIESVNRMAGGEE
jgi:hypothetical protein